jgi:hypothetical protein
MESPILMCHHYTVLSTIDSLKSFVYDVWPTENNTIPGCSSTSLRVTSRVGATVTFPVDGEWEPLMEVTDADQVFQ